MTLFSRMREDIETALRRDPAARSRWEVFLAYPGVHALWLHRLAHWLWSRHRHLLARLVSHLNRALTGVEIHPGAHLGRRVFIDHGMGIVIGETAVVADDVLLYQGVVLGGTSLEKVRRHPTIDEGVVIGAGAIVLGPITVGRNARVGAGSVVVKEVPPGATVVGVPARIAGRRVGAMEDVLDHGELPDPILRALSKVYERELDLEDRMRHLEETVARFHEVIPAIANGPAKDREQVVLERLRTVLDPEIGINVVDMGLVRNVRVSNGDVEVDMVLTTPACPVADRIQEQVRRALSGLPGVGRVTVKLLDEPWSWNGVDWFKDGTTNGNRDGEGPPCHSMGDAGETN